MIKRIFLSGLAVLIPLGITIYVIVGLFRFADGILGKYFNIFLTKTFQDTYIFSEGILRDGIPGIGIIISILIIFLAGLILHISRMKLIRWFEGMLFRIPLINKIYFPIKKIVDFFFISPKESFKRAVLVEYPRKGIFAIGFITNENADFFRVGLEERFYTIFIPSSPSPFTGFTVIATEQDITFLDMSVEEAIQLIVSGGMLSPRDS
jgi:uncharacterized membrane protein